MRIPALFAAALAAAAFSSAFADEPKDTAAPQEPAAAEPKAEITVPGAKNAEQAKAKLRADAAIGRCVIKPVMTDDEIQACIQAYRQSDQERAQRAKK